MGNSRSSWRVAAVLGGALCLSGCFASKAALITPETADTPFGQAAKVTVYVNCASEGGSLLGCTGYKASGGGTLKLDHGAYIVEPDPASNPFANMAGAQGPAQDMHVMLKNVGGDLYVAQIPWGDGTASDEDHDIYEMVRITGQTAYIYVVLCEQNGDQAYVKSGALTRISIQMLVPTCEADSLDGLATVFRDRIANGAIPDQKFEVQPAG
jgi:hypothetical protein